MLSDIILFELVNLGRVNPNTLQVLCVLLKTKLYS